MTKPKLVEVRYEGDLERVYMMNPNLGNVKRGDTFFLKASQLDELKEVGFVEVKDKDKGGEK